MKVIIVVMDGIIIINVSLIILFVVDIGGLNLSLTTPNKKSFNLFLGFR